MGRCIVATRACPARHLVSCTLSERAFGVETSECYASFIYASFKHDVKHYVPVALLAQPTRDVGETGSVPIIVGETVSVSIKTVSLS